ncbi:unnamed protein product [Dracunculus medinensis]|uniref:WD_REPEATS_REGION domain-containing protein n=1 Tax=Dracunculus medinensis TaxID=318479 RepID=A0A158Q418_DRAME|nr:unnamed protein product [Dracunculus medinensis]
MYELSKEIFMVNGSASNFPNNLDIHYDESKKLTYACIVHKQQVYDCPLQFTRGITSVNNLILVGTHIGDILVFEYANENSISSKKVIQEHHCAIVDIIKHESEDVICSCDVVGNIVIWTKSMKNIQSATSTGFDINCFNMLKNYLVIGTMIGEILLYSLNGAQLLIKINAHCRQINAISTASDNNYILTVAEDSIVHVWSLLMDTDPILTKSMKLQERFLGP